MYAKVHENRSINDGDKMEMIAGSPPSANTAMMSFYRKYWRHDVILPEGDIIWVTGRPENCPENWPENVPENLPENLPEKNEIDK